MFEQCIKKQEDNMQILKYYLKDIEIPLKIISQQDYTLWKRNERIKWPKKWVFLSKLFNGKHVILAVLKSSVSSEHKAWHIVCCEWINRRKEFMRTVLLWDQAEFGVKKSGYYLQISECFWALSVSHHYGHHSVLYS